MVRPEGRLLTKSGNFPLLEAAFPPLCIDWREVLCGQADPCAPCAKFHVNRCNESPLRGENADFWLVSKFNTGSLPFVTILGHKVDSFVYLGSSVDASGGNDSDIRRRIELAARTCMKSLDRGIWRSSISLVTIAQALQCLHSSGAPVWLGHMECDRSVETAS